jgi:hypothetical protein
MLTLIPTGEPTSGPHCFRATVIILEFFKSKKYVKKIAKGQELCSL